MTEENKNKPDKKWKKVVDILATISVMFIFVAPFLANIDFFVSSISTTGKLPILVKLGVADIFPAAFSVGWLLWRHYVPYVMKHPFMQTNKYRRRLGYGGALVYLAVYFLFLFIKDHYFS